MSHPASNSGITSEHSLSNAAVNHGMNAASFRQPIPAEATAVVGPPVLPPRPDFGMQQSYGMNPGYSYNVGGSYGMGSYGGYNGYGGYGYGGMSGGYGMPGMAIGGPYGGYNRFIQMAEEGTRPAFDSIQSLVNAVGSIAMMLENTFFALTCSFRAVLGVAENFGRLRSLFAQFWSTFAVIRSLNWLVRKLLVILGIKTENEFKAWAEAVAATQSGTATSEQKAKGSSWPVLLFFGVIAAAPYIVLRMIDRLSSNIGERLNDPASWQKPLKAVAQHHFQATSPQEISFSANQVLYLAPQHLQGNLWNSGWLMASVDKQTAGLVPVTYIKVIRPNNNVETAANSEDRSSDNNPIPNPYSSQTQEL
ncbi:peroxisomal membrane protein PEX13 isoform X2 [Battus philenor]|uniref:peroxisomal membrane protein PEX13 isoform X2 n=1 Tax=Battus philenor TaxID=42288 RepID=UPI0035D02363